MVYHKYWAARHRSKLDNVEQIFNIAEKLVRKLPPPWQRSRRVGAPSFQRGGMPRYA